MKFKGFGSLDDIKNLAEKTKDSFGLIFRGKYYCDSHSRFFITNKFRSVGYKCFTSLCGISEDSKAFDEIIDICNQSSSDVCIGEDCVIILENDELSFIIGVEEKVLSVSNNDNFILIHLKNKATIIVNKSDYSSFLYDTVETSKTVIHMSSCKFPLIEMYGDAVKKDFAKLKLLSGDTEFRFPKNNRCNSLKLINDKVYLRIPSFNMYYKFVDFTYESIEKLSLDKKLLINVVDCLYQFVNSDLFCIIRDNIVLCIFCLKTIVDSPRKYLKFTEDAIGFNIVIPANSYRDESCVIVGKSDYAVFKYY